MTDLTLPSEPSSSRLSFDSRSFEGVEPPASSKEHLSDLVLTEELSTGNQEPSEVQLRQLYDEEEVERFMYFFSAYVTEVRLPSASNVTPPPLPPRPGVTAEHRCTSPIPPLPRRPSDRSLSEHFANVLLPYLPLDGSTPPPFTVKRLRLASQRLYLATIPSYQALLLDLASLALWKDHRRSLLYCICFWILWYHDLLLAALLCRILWCLLRRRLFPYPSLEELQERRRNTAQARRFGEEIQQRLLTSTMGPVELWRLFRHYNKAITQNNVKRFAKGKSQSTPEQTHGAFEQSERVLDPDDKTILEYSDDSEEVQELKRDLLHLVNIVADVHERIKNIFMWRRPTVTKRYGILLSIMTVAVLILPTHYIAKSIYLSWGVIYWHVVPVIAALSPADRTRVPALFGDAPTDAEYAMDLIGERVASGQDITLRGKKVNQRQQMANVSNSNVDESRPEEKGGVDWKKWGARIAQGKSLLEDNKPISSISRAVLDKLSPEKQSTTHSSDTEHAHTFPAQHSSSLGLITLTPSEIYFTSLTALRPKLVIPRSQLRGVKKTSHMKGLVICWVPAHGEENEENFHWVGSRDELFARLLGADSRRWIRLRAHGQLTQIDTNISTPPVDLETSLPVCPLFVLLTILWLYAMFFSPDLLSKRDSGFGLLWLAATLGPKSAFRKLPKRSVLSADITQLCELIATPVEPLALRLSSNLLVGAARVYKAKQDIFMTDVTTCFNSLKRVIDEFRSATTSEAQLQMAQPSVKSSAVTLRIDPDAAFAIDLDNVIGNWSEYLTFEDAPVASADASSDDEYNPKPQKGKRKAKMSAIPPLGTETARVNMHTLDENHGFLTTDSFDASFGEQGAAINSTSETGGFRFDDAFFEPFDGLDMNEGIGDDLVMELGEEWGAIPTKQNAEEDIHPDEVQTGFGYSAADIDYDMHVNDDAEMVPQEILQPALSESLYQDTQDQQAQLPPISPPLQSVESSHTSPEKPQVKCGDGASRDEAALPKKMKRARLVLDCRIELTDEELKTARVHYLEGQGVIRRELHIKKVEKERASLIHDLLWSAPDNVHAKELANFWINHYKMQVEARSCHTDVPDEYRVTNCAKKQIDVLATPTLGGNSPKSAQEVPAPGDSPTAISAPLETDMIDFAFDYDPEINFDMDGSRLRSSEEPGQGRHASRPPSALYDNLGAVVDNSLSSRRSGLFPWDHAGKSTSEIGQEGSFRLQDGDKMSVDHAETRLRGNSLIRRDSSLPTGSLRPSIGSPVVAFQGSRIDDDFAFDVPEDDSVMMLHDPQKGQANLPALEKNSSNFLEYARMQYQSLSGSSLYLTFDDVMPKASSTAHVAAAALYHCLVLGTKNLVQLHQEKSYGQITIRIK